MCVCEWNVVRCQRPWEFSADVLAPSFFRLLYVGTLMSTANKIRKSVFDDARHAKYTKLERKRGDERF